MPLRLHPNGLVSLRIQDLNLDLFARNKLDWPTKSDVGHNLPARITIKRFNAHSQEELHVSKHHFALRILRKRVALAKLLRGRFEGFFFNLMHG